MVDIFVSYSRVDCDKVEIVLSQIKRLKIDGHVIQNCDYNEVTKAKTETASQETVPILVFWTRETPKDPHSVSSLSPIKAGNVINIVLECQQFDDPFMTMSFLEGMETYWIDLSSDWVRSRTWMQLLLRLSALLGRDFFGFVEAMDSRSVSHILVWAENNKHDPLFDVALRDAYDTLQETIRQRIANKTRLASQDNIEREIKLGAENIQARYIMEGDYNLLVDAIRYALVEMNFVVGKTKKRINIDRYFDFMGILYKYGYFLRVREQEGSKSISVTIKSLYEVSETRGEKALSREEYNREFDTEEIQKLIQDPQKLILLVSKGKLNFKLPSISEQLSIKNRRREVVVRDLEADYKVSFDKFYFIDPATKMSSEYFHELEIECASENVDPGGLARISNLISSLAGLTSHKSSKHSRALAWLSNDKQRIENNMVVAFEIIDYDSLDDIGQQQALLALNRSVKEELYKKGEDLIELTYLSTGSGFAIVLSDHQKKMIAPALVKVGTENRAPPSIGMAIGYGPVFRYSDLNERVSYGGALIQRTIQVARHLRKPGVVYSPSATIQFSGWGIDLGH